MNNKLLKLLQISITLGLLVWVFYQAGLMNDAGQQRFIDTLKKANLWMLLASFLVGVLVNIVSAFKWYLLAKARELGAGYWRVFAYYLVGQFYNMFLPTSVGGDVVRSYELGKFSGRQADSLASVFVERYTGVVTLLVLSALAVLTQLSRFNQDYVLISLAAFALGLGTIAWLVFDQRPYHYIKRVVIKSVPASQKVFGKLDRLLLAVDAFKDQPRAIAVAFINSFLFYLVAVLNVYITALVFNAEVAFIDILIATPIIMLIMNVPLSLGNIGLMEFAYISVLQLMGYGAELGLSVAILMRIKSLFDGAMGGVLHPIFVTQKHE